MGRGGKKLLSCGAVVVRDTADGPRFLMLRAFSHWDFPKGICESGETPQQCMIREVREETALDDLDFPWGNEYVETGPYSRGKVARYYLAKTGRKEIEMLPNPETGRAEHVEYRWCTIAEATRLAAPRVKGVIAWAVKRLGAD